MSELNPIIIRFKGDLSELQSANVKAVDASKAATDKIAKQWDELGKQMQATGKKMSLALTVPIVAFGKVTTTTFAKFERNLQTIVGLVGIAQTQVDAWRDSILALGPAIGRGPVELSEAMFFITSAGIRGQAALDALTMSAKASAAGLGETKSVALAVVSVMNTWADSGMTAAMATDILVKTIREGNLEAASLSQSLGMVLGTAKAAGATFADVGAAIAVMTQQGLNAALSVTALNAVFSILLSSSKETETMLTDVGLSLEGLRTTLREEGLLVLLQSLSTAFQNNQSALAQLIPEKRALRAVLSLTGQDAEKVGKIFDSVANATGALDEAVAAVANTADMRLNKAAARLESSMVRFGDTMRLATVPATEEFASIIEDLSASMARTSDSTKELAAAVLGLLAAVGPVLLALGTFVVIMGKLKTTAVVTSVMAVLSDVVASMKLRFAGAATSAEAFNASLLKTQAIAGGMTIALAAIAIGFTLIMKAARQAEKDIDAATAAQVRAAATLDPWKAKILGLNEANSELFGEWKSKVDELREQGMETSAAWVKAWQELDISDRLVEAAAAAARLVEETRALERAAALAAAAAEKLTGQYEDLLLAMRTPEEIFTDTIAGLDKMKTELAAIGIEGDVVEETFRRAAVEARRLFMESIPEAGTGLFDALQRLKDLSGSLMDELRRNVELTKSQFENLRQSVRTPQEIFEETIAALDLLELRLKLVGMSGEEVTETLRRLREQAGKTFTEATTEVDELDSKVESLGMTFTSAFEDAIVSGKKLSEVLKGLKQDVMRIFLRETVTEPLGMELAEMFRGVFKTPTPSAKGNVFSAGRVQPFASGGLITSPVLFPMADGIGSAGENGIEAIMPLQRTASGKLGVAASGGGGAVHNTFQMDVVYEIRSIDSRDTARMIEEQGDRIADQTLRKITNDHRFRRVFMRGS